MNNEFISTAPQARMDSNIYERWLRYHTGTEDDFFNFMTVPSVERELFLSSLDYDIDFSMGVGFVTYSA